MNVFELYTSAQITDEFKKNFQRTLSNWSYLSYYLSMHNPEAETIGKLIRMELESKRRLDILQRLTQRLGSLIRKQLQQELAEVLNART